MAGVPDLGAIAARQRAEREAKEQGKPGPDGTFVDMDALRDRWIFGLSEIKRHPEWEVHLGIAEDMLKDTMDRAAVPLDSDSVKAMMTGIAHLGLVAHEMAAGGVLPPQIVAALAVVVDNQGVLLEHILGRFERKAAEMRDGGLVAPGTQIVLAGDG